MIISAVHPLTGKKINVRDAEYRHMKDCANEIAAEYGLSTIDWRAAVKKKRSEEIQPELPMSHCFAERGMIQQGKDVWKGELRNIIDGAIIGCYSLDDFRKNLAKNYVILTRCTARCITYKLGDYPPVRGDTLGGEITPWLQF